MDELPFSYKVRIVLLLETVGIQPEFPFTDKIIVEVGAGDMHDSNNKVLICSSVTLQEQNKRLIQHESFNFSQAVIYKI